METARNLPISAKASLLPVVANLEMQLTERNLNDLIDGQSIQVAAFGGINLKMTLDKSVTRDILIRIGSRAARELPILGTPPTEDQATTMLPSRTEVTGEETSL